MAVKVAFWACFAAFLVYYSYQELTVVTEIFAVKKFIPAKRTDVFDLLLNLQKLWKFHPLL